MIVNKDSIDALVSTYRLALSPAVPWNEFKQADFDVFCEEIYKTLNTPEVFELLISPPHEDNKTLLREQSARLGQIASWLSGMKARANGFVRAWKKAKKSLKMNGSTDLDRTIDIEGNCNKAISLAELICDMKYNAQQNIMLCQTLMNSLDQDEIQARTGD